MLPAIRTGSLVPTTSAGPVNRIASLFDRFFNDDFFAPLTTAPGWSTLPLGMWEDEQNVYVEADVPGMTDKEIDVSVHNGEIVIQGERKCERKEGGYDCRSYGRFERRLTLPTPVDADKVEAKLTNGVLHLTFPKSEEAKPRRIAIKSE